MRDFLATIAIRDPPEYAVRHDLTRASCSPVSGETDLQNLLNSMSQQQLISLLSGGSVGGNLSGLLG